MSDLYGMLIGGAILIATLVMAYFKGQDVGEDGERLKQYERANDVIKDDREKQKGVNKINETVDSRDKSDRDGLLHYAAASDQSGDAREEDSADA